MRLIYKITIPVVAVLGAFSFLVYFVFSSSLQDAMVNQEFLQVRDAVTKGANQTLVVADFADPTTASSTADFDQFLAQVTDPSIARVTVWNEHQVAIFSDLPSIVGQELRGSQDVSTALSTGQPFFSVKVSDASTPEQTNISNFIDIFVPLRVNGDVLGVAEVRAVIGAILKPISQQINNISLGLVIAAIIICGAVLLAFRLFVTAPISELEDVSAEVIKGNLAARAKIKTKDELGEVTQFINAMLNRVEESQKTLEASKEIVEAQVKVRTEELTEEKARLISSLNSLSLGFLITRSDDTVIYANPAVQQIFDTKGEPITMAAIDSRLKQAFDFSQERKKSMERRSTIELKEVRQENRFLRVFVAPIVVEQSENVIGTVAVFEDITEAKLLDYAKNSFVAIASHELRTPLTIIRGNAELLLDDIKASRPAEELSARVNSIYGGSIRLLGIVNDFLDLTALEERKVQFKKDIFDVRVLAEDIAKDLLPRAAAKSLELTIIKPEGSLPNVVADRERTKEVFVNLIANAIQYTEKGGIKISFVVDGKKLKVLFTDTGVGIPDDRQRMLFKKFNTVQEKFLRTREYGSGMGLYISRLIMDSMGGEITLAKSVSGEGSTFSASFNIAENPPKA